MAEIVVDNLVTSLEELSAKQPSAWLGMPLERAEDVTLPLHVSAPTTEPYCCVVDCPQPATVRIYDTRPETPYDVAETHACADHVRELGGDEPYSDLYRFDDDRPFKSKSTE